MLTGQHPFAVAVKVYEFLLLSGTATSDSYDTNALRMTQPVPGGRFNRRSPGSPGPELWRTGWLIVHGSLFSHHCIGIDRDRAETGRQEETRLTTYTYTHFPVEIRTTAYCICPTSSPRALQRSVEYLSIDLTQNSDWLPERFPGTVSAARHAQPFCHIITMVLNEFPCQHIITIPNEFPSVLCQLSQAH